MPNSLEVPQSTLRQAKSLIKKDCKQRITIVAGHKVIEIFNIETFLKQNGFIYNYNSIIKSLIIRGFLIPTNGKSFYIINASEKNKFLESYNEMNELENVI